MNELVILNMVFLFWGSLLGLIYFGGLWLTVRRLTIAQYQGLWMAGSFLIRNLLVAAGFYPVVVQGWKATVFCLAGFILIRVIFIRCIKIQTSRRNEV